MSVNQPSGGLSPRMWWLLSAVIAGGIGLFLYVVVSGIAGAGRQYVRAEAPGSMEVRLPESGAYYIFHEYKRTDGETAFEPPAEFEELHFSLIDRDSGQEIAIAPVTEPIIYNLQRRRGEARYRFHVNRPAEIVVLTTYPAGSEGPSLGIAVGQPYAQRIRETFFGASGVVIVTMLLVSGLLLYGRGETA